MFSKFFIERPVLSNVIAIITMILGAVALFNLPVAQNPDITPPTVVVSTTYPGANPEIVSETVGAPIEQQVNGVERMLYMSSKSSSDGGYALTVTFEVGTNLDMATVLVQNRVNAALPRLPLEVQRQGVTVKKRSPDILLVVALTSPDSRYDSLFLSNYGTLHVQDELARVNGVGDLRVFGADEYGMRVWLDPGKLKSMNLSAQDVVSAIAQQNLQVAAGQVGQPPAPNEQNFQLTVQTKGRLSSPEEFGDIIVKSGLKPVRVKDVARVELGGRTYDLFAQKTGLPAALIPVYLQPGANALDVANRVLKRMDELSKEFPEGLEWSNAFDTTTFVQKAVDDVYWTLIEAALLVLVVIMLFLQDWRAMLVPATTVPVTILGAFIAMYALGFSVNLVTLFAIILAIGIVVDDAIIVVEGAAHQMEMGMNSHDAAIKAMTILFGPIIGITLVLVSVFLPAAFLPGITGLIYRQFALVIAATAVISAINAATLKPTQCALWLKMPSKKKNWFFRGFNRAYAWTEARYTSTVSLLVRFPKTAMLFYLVLMAVTAWGFMTLPKSFLPEEDQGFALISTQLPGGASQARTRQVVDQISQILSKTPGVEGWVSFGGLSILDGVNQPNMATTFVRFKPWDERKAAGLSQRDIVGNIQRQLFGMGDAIGFVFIPPAIRGIGQAGGFEMVVQDRGGNQGSKGLEQAVRSMIQQAAGEPRLGRLNTTYTAGNPQLFVDVDRTQAMAYGVRVPEVFSTLQTYLGSSYVNDFNLFGRVYQVRVQADAPFRLKAEDIRKLEVRNEQGNMVPLGSLVSIKDITGPQVVTRYNMYRGASILGSAAPGVSSGQAISIMEKLAEKLPTGMGFDWTAISYQEKRVGNEAYLIFGMAVLLIYLVLAAQYESWFIPGAVILVTPLAMLGTMVALRIRGLDNNVYTQIGIVLLIALASKNAILIVEYARELRTQGKSIVESAIEAAKLRLRPILMTSFAFIMGVTPLLTATGAGAASQHAIGTAVFGGMIASTFVAILVVPVFYVLIQSFVERFLKPRRPGPTHITPVS